MSRKVRVAALSFQLGSEPVSRDERVAQAVGYVEAAADDGADLVLLPEGFDALQTIEARRRSADEDRDTLLEDFETEDGPTAERLRETARTRRIIVVANHTIRDGSDFFNQATFIDRDGEIVGRYRKVQLTQNEYEGKGTTPGDEIRPIELEGVRYGVLICHDMHFPEVAQIYALQGVDVLLNPTQAAGPTEELRYAMLKVRAHDTSAYLATSSFIQGTRLSWNTRLSRATVVDPNGFVIADSGHREGPVCATLDLDEDRWTSWCTTYDHRRTIGRQRRTDLYARYYAELGEGTERMVPPLEHEVET